MKQIFVHGLGQTPASWNQTSKQWARGKQPYVPIWQS